MTDSATKVLTLGSWGDCDLVFEGETVALIHAHAELDADGRVGIVDAGSEHGTWLHRNGQWVRVLKVDLGSRDRIRLGAEEIDVAQLVDRFGGRVRVRLRNLDALQLPKRLQERLEAAQTRAAIERPRRNPDTGAIEEDR